MIESETVEQAGNWGVEIAWRDRNGTPRSEIFGRELFAGDCREVRNRLAAGGLTISGDTRSRQAFCEYLNLAKTDKRAHCVERTGWHIIGGKRVFVLPDLVIGQSSERVILQKDGQQRAPFNRSGTLESWRSSIGTFAIGNTRLVFCICTAFAGPLMNLVDEEGGGANLKGNSRLGKSTALRVAASVWGGDKERGSAAFIRSWRATANGLESTAVQHSDAALLLDELGQIEAKQVGETAYMLANGAGKSRATRDGGARPPARWRTLFLSTGEVGIADKNTEAKIATKAGMEIRLLDIAADAGAGFGLFEDLHGFETAEKFAEELKSAGRVNFGTAGVAFLEWLVDRLGRDPEFISGLVERIDEIMSGWFRGMKAAGGQVKSVARRFALIAVAGELATKAMITGWCEDEATIAAHAMFKSWLAERGTLGASEDRQAIRQLADFIGRHGNGQFELWVKQRPGADAEISDDEAPPVERNRTLIRSGWRCFNEATAPKAFTYYVLDEAMRRALEGLNFSASIKTLCDAGMILRDSGGKSTTGRKPPGSGIMRLYVVPGNVIGSEDGSDGS